MPALQKRTSLDATCLFGLNMLWIDLIFCNALKAPRGERQLANMPAHAYCRLQ